MMTTAKTFGIEQRHTDPIMGPLVENTPPTAPSKTKAELLDEYVQQYLAGTITAKQLDVIKKTFE